jgi:hypothetical protein
MEYLKFGIKLTLGFFIAGTAVLIIFYFNPSSEIALMAYQFTLVAIIVNWFYVLILLFNLLKRKISILNLMKTLGIMAINIPVGVLYSYLMVWILSYARITFRNNTGTDIARLTIQGCEHKLLNNLHNKASKTVWIKISGDCNIEITYEINGQMKSEKVVDYLTPTEGFRTFYELRGDS